MAAPGMEIHQMMVGASQLATSALAAALWQGMLLAGAAAVGLRLLPETPAPVRFAIWFAVFLLVGGLPFATVSFRDGAAGSGASAQHAWLTLDTRWCLAIAGLWAAASMVRAITLVLAAFRVRVLWKRAKPIEVSLQQTIGRKAQVCASNEVDRPTVIGFFAPKIVIPEWLLAKLTPAELEHVVLHEAGHLSRRDDWLNLLQKLALVVFPLNPALAWVERRLCFERELACDERVLRATGAPKAYAACLATLAGYRLERRGLVRELALALGAIGRESELGQRVLRILSGGGRMERGHARMVFGGSMLTLVFAASALERSPQIVGFTHAPVASAEPAIAQARGSGVRAVAVRASMPPTEQWKTVGDAAPHVAKHAAEHKAKLATGTAAEIGPAYKSLMAGLGRDGFLQEVLSSRTSNAQMVRSAQDETLAQTGRFETEPRVIQTLSTTRQVMADGGVVVTRLVTVRAYDVNPDTSRSISDAPQAEAVPSQQKQQQAHPYAAVPVQGGWLLFQL